ncbi:hypothetical protein BJY04DRAFT_218624 [Aspergillus karnatakaensis]|uniref:uncharacterized protein n=1 Tax=Aspergillus karnatakaensis TaxID=1810916 RepID=UPI003CCDCE3D
MGAIFVPLMLLAVAIRVYVRTCIIRLWGAEDTTCILAACGSVASMGVMIKCVSLGLGRHLWDVPVRILLDVSNNRILSDYMTYPWTVCFAKLSILLLYKRLFLVGWERIAIWAGIVMVTVLYGTFILLAILNTAICINEYSTDLWATLTSFCVFQHRQVLVWTAAVNISTDFYVVILPINRFVRLQISRRKKIGLCMIFASGLGACAASVARSIMLLKHLYTKDTTWISAELSMYSYGILPYLPPVPPSDILYGRIAEMNIGIIVACVCTFPKFIQRMHDLQISQVLGRLPRKAQLSLSSIFSLKRDQPSRSSKTMVSGSGYELEIRSSEYVCVLEGVDTRGSIKQPRDF